MHEFVCVSLCVCVSVSLHVYTYIIVLYYDQLCLFDCVAREGLHASSENAELLYNLLSNEKVYLYVCGSVCHILYVCVSIYITILPYSTLVVVDNFVVDLTVVDYQSTKVLF